MRDREAEREIERGKMYRKINHKPRFSSKPTNKTEDEKTLE